MGRKKNMLPVIIAVGVALVVAGLARWIKSGSFTSNQQSKAKKELSMPDIPLMVNDTKRKLDDQVLVVANDIKNGAKITIKDLTWKKWPSDAIQPNFIVRNRREALQNNKSDYKNVLNMWAITDIPTGVPLSMNMLTNIDPKSLEEEKRKKEEEEKKKLQMEKDSTFIGKGMRAITFPVDQRSASSSSMLHPENLVDVLIIERQGDKTKTHKYSALKVLAIDGVTKFGDKKNDAANPPKNVTLEIKEDCVEEMLRLVGNNGIILSLRNQNEEIKNEVKVPEKKEEEIKDQNAEETLLQSIIDMNHTNSMEALHEAKKREEEEEAREANLAMFIGGTNATGNNGLVNPNENELHENDSKGKYEIVSGKIIGEPPEPDKKAVTIFRKLSATVIPVDKNGHKLEGGAAANPQIQGSLKEAMMKSGAAVAGSSNPRKSMKSMNLGV